jgi:endonuclease III
MARLDRNENALHEYAQTVTVYIEKLSKVQETLAAMIARTETESRFVQEELSRLQGVEHRLREVENRFAANTVISHAVTFVGGALLISLLAIFREWVAKLF